MHQLSSDQIKNLLGRERELRVFTIEDRIKEKAVLVTGAGGSIGSELCLQLIAMKPSKLILYEMSEFALYKIEKSLGKNINIIPLLGNLSNRFSIEKILKTFKIDCIFHAAAYKHVPLVEYNPIPSIENNVWGAKNLIDAAREAGAKDLVIISTDKAVNPTNIMGVTKKLVEYIALSSTLPYKVVRFGNVLWSNGSVLPLFLEQLQEHRPLTITHSDVSRYFMSVEEAVSLVLQSLGVKDSICILDMGDPIRIVDVAERLASLVGLEITSMNFIGLRPGEKLHEELTLGESLSTTPHPFIQSAHESVPSYEELSGWLKHIHFLCNRGDLGALRLFFQKIIPGYNPTCGIVDRVWLEEFVLSPTFDDDCFTPAKP